jgi:TRAP-type C4-dicarboxylate transport system permease large subunit
MPIVYSYLVYLAVSLTVTVWVARTLHQRGRVFLIDAFHGQQELADSVNHMLVVGFYLINVGYVAFALRTGENPAGLRQAIELVSDKLGVVLLVLGVMHFFNLFVFSRVRSRAQESSAPPPFPPDALLTPTEQPQRS